MRSKAAPSSGLQGALVAAGARRAVGLVLVVAGVLVPCGPGGGVASLQGDRSAVEPPPTYAPPPRDRSGHRVVNTAHARRRGPGERANAEIENWKVLRKIRSSPSRADTLIKADQTLILAG